MHFQLIKVPHYERLYLLLQAVIEVVPPFPFSGVCVCVCVCVCMCVCERMHTLEKGRVERCELGPPLVDTRCSTRF